MDHLRELEEAAPDAVVDHRYLVRREIARGGMACVFEAVHVVTGARVALKTLHRPSLDSVAARARILREARVLGSLRHPNIVLVQDAGTCDKHGPFVVLELIEGRTLDGILTSRQTLPVGQAVAVAHQLLCALEVVHRHGIVHRDVKPSNVLVSRLPDGDQIELIDFGIAQVGADADSATRKLTQAGEILGTVEYMAPERILEAGPVDATCDVYSVGVVLFECLLGEVPASGVAGVLASVASGRRLPSIRSRREEVPLELEAVVMTALEADPKRRYASAKEFADACVRALGGLVPRLALLEVGDDRKASAPPPAPSQETMAAAETPHRRRQFVRAPYIAPVRIVLPDGASVDGRTEDISEGGALVVTDIECGPDQQVKLRIPLPRAGKVVVIDAATKWIRTHRNRRAIGVEFQDVAVAALTDIRSYVALMAGEPQTPPRVGP